MCLVFIRHLVRTKTEERVTKKFWQPAGLFFIAFLRSLYSENITLLSLHHPNISEPKEQHSLWLENVIELSAPFFLLIIESPSILKVNNDIKRKMKRILFLISLIQASPPKIQWDISHCLDEIISPGVGDEQHSKG